MTREEAKELLPIIEAYANGKAIEVKACGENDMWRAINNVFFEGAPSDYRIKPEPKLRPWTPGEAIGKVIRHKVGRDYTVVLWACGDYCDCQNWNRIKLEKVLEIFEQPNGKPCGVMEVSND